MSKSKEYKAIKNYIHNELGFTKEDIIKEVKPFIKEIVKNCMNNTYGNNNCIENWIRCTVSDEIRRVTPLLVSDIYKDVLREKIEESIEVTITKKTK